MLLALRGKPLPFLHVYHHAACAPASAKHAIRCRCRNASSCSSSPRQPISHRNPAADPFLPLPYVCSTLVLCWTQLVAKSTMQWVPIVLNLMVHVPMYFYYAVSLRFSPVAVPRSVPPSTVFRCLPVGCSGLIAASRSDGRLSLAFFGNAAAPAARDPGHPRVVEEVPHHVPDHPVLHRRAGVRRGHRAQGGRALRLGPRDAHFAAATRLRRL